MLKALKENLALLSLMVVLAGTSSSDSYYAVFGVRYQSLDLPASHILFRGLTAVWGYPPLGIAYLAALAIMAGQSRVAVLLGGLDRVRWLNHAAIVLAVVVAWAGGNRAGSQAARQDASSASSSLPLISRIDLKAATPAHVPSSPAEGYRLLLQDKGGIRFFKALEHPATESPLVHYMSTEAIDAITTCPVC